VLLALIGGLPATAVAVWFAWTRAPSLDLRIVFTSALVLFWLGCALALRRSLDSPLRTLASMMEAIRDGDYAMRGRRGQQNDTLGELAREINLLSETLQNRRMDSIEASALMHTVLEELDTAVFAFDEAQRLKLANRAAAELLGRSVESLIGRPATDLGLADLPASSGVVSLAFPERTGRFEVRCRPFRESGLPHTLVVVSDLSRALREEERRAVQRLIRVINHEINNSLAPIKSLAGTLSDMLRKERSLLPEEDLQSMLGGLSLINDRAGSLSKFVTSYSQLARLPQPTKAPVSLSAVLQRLLALKAYAGASLQAPFDVVVDVDAGQLEQALLNLLQNAVEATGGSSNGMEVLLSRTRATVCIEIRDRGCGIANPDSLFVPFFTTKAGGSGIGLALSRQIIEAHGGTLALENRTGHPGCVARVVLAVAAGS
jgi:two-component system, NtrC family, nitrogen regulation sensor histidine kinase NtrY